MAFRAIGSFLLLLALVLIADVAAALREEAVSYDVRNAAYDTVGGRRFDTGVGRHYARRVLEVGSSDVLRLFHQTTTTASVDRKPIEAVSLLVVDRAIAGGCTLSAPDGAARVVELSARYIASYAGDIQDEVTGMLYRELARVWQWDGEGRANAGLVDGIADLVRLRSGHSPAGWAKPGEGTRWDERSGGVTARFLEYLETNSDGFIAKLNNGLKKATSGEEMFQKITGKTVEQLWAEYKSAYGII
ncbi:hypothetical protein ACP4OV_024526 [Aristida adscensionis]